MNWIDKIGVLICILCLPAITTGAESYSADNLTQPIVQAAVTACLEDVECEKVYLPAGESDAWENRVKVSGPITIMGAGRDQTIINIDPSNKTTGAAFDCNADGEFIRISSMRINSTNRTRGKPSVISIKYSWDAGFRIDHIDIFGAFTTGGAIGFKYAWKGLVDHVTIEDDNPGPNLPYGITLGGPSWEPSTPECSTYDADCIQTWDDQWWDNIAPKPEGHNGQDFDENYLPGTDAAIFIEDCTFKNVRSAVMWNWSSKGAVVVRHNKFYSGFETAGPLASAKPGAVWFDCYENDFFWTGEGFGPVGQYVRCSGTIHDNRYHNLARAGYITCYSGYTNGHLWTPQVQMDELYIWNNTYDNCKYNGDSACREPGDCGWKYVDSYNKAGVTCGYFFRQPAEGDRIYPYKAYEYPHPLVMGAPMPVPVPDTVPDDESNSDPDGVPDTGPGAEPGTDPNLPIDPGSDGSGSGCFINALGLEDDR